MNTMPRIITDIARRAAIVGSRFDASREAFAAEQEAEAELWRTAIDEALPALPALSSRIQIGRTADDEAIWHNIPGLYVGALDDAPGPTGGVGCDYMGEDLFLLANGTLLEVNYHGPRGVAWDSEHVIVTPEEAHDGYKTVEFLTQLSRALEANIRGNTKLRTEQALAKAERLKRAADVLRG